MSWQSRMHLQIVYIIIRDILILVQIPIASASTLARHYTIYSTNPRIVTNFAALTKYSRSLLDIKLKHVIMNKSADIHLNCHAQIQRGEEGGGGGYRGLTILSHQNRPSCSKYGIKLVSNGL